MILMIDNFDSFTFNLVQYMLQMDYQLEVARNDAVSLDEVRRLKPTHIVISPGPGRPENAGISGTLVRELGQTIPILGVCLGHQCIGQVFGGKVVHAKSIMHGKTSAILHQGEGVFKGLPNPFRATRYHSLAVSREGFPAELLVTAETEDGEIMGLQHRNYPIHGVQFHPESILSEQGFSLLRNFLES